MTESGDLEELFWVNLPTCRSSLNAGARLAERTLSLRQLCMCAYELLNDKNRSSLLSKLVRKWPFFCRRCNLSRCFTNNGCPLRTRYIRTFIEELSRLINMGMLISQRCAFYDLVTFFINTLVSILWTLTMNLLIFFFETQHGFFLLFAQYGYFYLISIFSVMFWS